MHAICSPLVARLVQLTPWMRYLLIAILCHSAILTGLTVARITVPQLKPQKAEFEPIRYPLPSTTEESVVATVPGTGDGGNPLAGGTVAATDIKTFAQRSDTPGISAATAPLIGPIGDAEIGALARLEGNFGGIAEPTVGFAPNRFGTAGIWGRGATNDFALREKNIPMPTTSPTERHILAALRWLKENQQPDGSWKSSRPVAVTGLATLAFLGHGEIPDSREFGTTVIRAFSYLVSHINPNANLYDHAILTYALAESYGMTQSPALKEPLQHSVDILLRAQQVAKKDPLHTGGWRYTANAQDSDTSVTGWCVQALHAAKLAGANVPDSAFENASRYLWQMFGGGTFGYTTPGGGIPARTSTTAIGVLCQSFMGHGNDPRTRQALDKLKPIKLDWNKDSGHLKCTTYMWYYLTQAFYHGGGSYWEHWGKGFRDALIQHQSDDGHWEAPPQSDEMKYGPAYLTAMCALMLEVEYRYLPTYQRSDDRQLAQGQAGVGR